MGLSLSGGSAGPLRLPDLGTGLSTALVGGWGVARSGSSSGSLPAPRVSGVENGQGHVRQRTQQLVQILAIVSVKVQPIGSSAMAAARR
jgi:hypothetical protein